MSESEWRAAGAALLAKEKQLTRELDALAAERRRLPMVRVEKTYTFAGPDGPASLAELFDGRRQLVVYHFRFAPGGDPCVGCSSFADIVPRLEHLRARDTNLVLISRASLDEIEAYKRRMEWTVPWYSSQHSEFNFDLGLSSDAGERFALSVFLRDGDEIFRTYETTARGVDRLRFDFNLLDLTPYGRQESWEDSPPGWPQTGSYTWWRRHDEYPD